MEYCVTAVYNSCESAPTCSTIEYNSILNNSSNTNLKIYPNPASRTLHISGLNEGISLIELFTITGNAVIKKEADTANIGIDISGLAKGIYLVRISNGE